MSMMNLHFNQPCLAAIRQIDPEERSLACIGKRRGVPNWAKEDYTEDNKPLSWKRLSVKSGCDTGSIFAGLPHALIFNIIRMETERKQEEEARKAHKDKFQMTLDIIERCEEETNAEFQEEEWGRVCPYTVGEQIIHLIAIDNEWKAEHRRRGWTDMYPDRYRLDSESYYGYWIGEYDYDADWDFMRNRYTNHNLP